MPPATWIYHLCVEVSSFDYENTVWNTWLGPGQVSGGERVIPICQDFGNNQWCINKWNNMSFFLPSSRSQISSPLTPLGQDAVQVATGGGESPHSPLDCGEGVPSSLFHVTQLNCQALLPNQPQVQVPLDLLRPHWRAGQHLVYVSSCSDSTTTSSSISPSLSIPSFFNLFPSFQNKNWKSKYFLQNGGKCILVF